MNNTLLVVFFRRLTLCGFTNLNPTSLALVGIWRIALVLCCLAAVGGICSPAFIYLDAKPISAMISSSFILYPLQGLVALAHITIVTTLIVMMANMMIALGRPGQSKA